MSIVTVLATTKYISVMSDGRITGDDGNVNCEDYSKVLLLNKNTLIAFVGRVECFELLLAECNFNNYDNYEDIALHTYEKFSKSQAYNRDLIIVIGGKDSNGDIGFYYFSNMGHEITHVKPKEDNAVNHVLLARKEFEIEIILNALLRTIGFDTADKATFIQKQIHDYQALHDITVNANKYHVIIKR